MQNDEINKAYISPIDLFLYNFDQTHAPSASQIAEIEKYKKVFKLRDNPQPDGYKEKLWEEF